MNALKFLIFSLRDSVHKNTCCRGDDECKYTQVVEWLLHKNTID